MVLVGLLLLRLRPVLVALWWGDGLGRMEDRQVESNSQSNQGGTDTTDRPRPTRAPKQMLTSPPPDAATRVGIWMPGRKADPSPSSSSPSSTNPPTSPSPPTPAAASCSKLMVDTEGTSPPPRPLLVRERREDGPTLPPPPPIAASDEEEAGWWAAVVLPPERVRLKARGVVP